MSTITKEWLQKAISQHESMRDEIPFGLDEDDSNTLAALRIALASLEAEPVAYIIQDADARSRGEKGILRYFANISDEDINEYQITVTPLYTAPPAPIEAEPVAYVMADDLKDSSIISTPAYRDLGEAMERTVGDVVALYTAPPAPVSMKDHQIRELVNELRDIAVEYHGTQQLRERIARTVRASMLQGAENAGSTTTMHTAPALDSSPKIAESTSGKSPVIPDWQAKAEKMAELHGRSFVVFRNGESPQCADPAKVIISFTDEGLGHGSAAPLQEAKNV